MSATLRRILRPAISALTTVSMLVALGGSVPARGATRATTIYSVDFVSAAAFGVAMNDAGDVTGTSYQDTGCGPFCLPPLDTVVWKGGVRIVLPTVPGFTGIHVASINNAGWVAGYAGVPGTTTHAVVWKPTGTSYVAIDLGNLPGKVISTATGIDDLGRVVGWSTTQNFPPVGAPFMWTESGGMVDLSAQGFPSETPLGISHGGTVATSSSWYRLGDPTSVTALAPAPTGFSVESSNVGINDAGDQARFLVSTQPENLVYPFRYHHEGSWQQISFTGTGHLTSYGVGSINAAQDVTVTVAGTGQVAFGPDGLAQSLDGYLSPAYGGVVTGGGPMNASGQILAQVLIGLEGRLVRLTPATACGASCIRVSSLLIRAKFHQDPNDPGHCTFGNPKEYNLVRAAITVTSETGAKLSGVVVNGRFLDEYWTNAVVSGTTNARGVVQFDFRGPCGVGAETFLVDSATKAPLVFDKTVGVLAGYTIPQ